MSHAVLIEAMLRPPRELPALPGARARRALAERIVAGALVLVVASILIYWGLLARQWTWEACAPLRFTGDIGNAWNWASRINDDATRAVAGQRHVAWPDVWHAYVATYPAIEAQHANEIRPGYGLDYPPLRLLVMTTWVKYVRDHHPEARQWSDAVTYPLLYFNTTLELIACVLIFFLVRLWVRREHGDTHAGWIAGLGSAALLWFNPCVLLNAHGWPQWDVWVVPFFLAAVLLASLNAWGWAGACVILGAFLKGQMILAAPIFPLWALFSGRFFGAGRFFFGGAGALAVLASPWLLRNDGALLWVAGVVGFVVFVLACRFSTKIFFDPAEREVDKPFDRYKSFRRSFGIVAATACVAVFLASWLFDGSYAWLRIGFLYSDYHYLAMNMGPASNAASILSQAPYSWSLFNPTITWTWLGATEPMSFRWLMRSMYIATLVLCAIGAAIQSRRNSARTLIALVAPWVAFFALMPQMHERYLLWGAALTSVAVACGLGLTLLHLVITALAVLPTLHTMLHMDPAYAPKWLDFISRTHPGIGWMVLTAAAICVFAGLSRQKSAASSLQHRD